MTVTVATLINCDTRGYITTKEQWLLLKSNCDTTELHQNKQTVVIDATYIKQLCHEGTTLHKRTAAVAT